MGRSLPLPVWRTVLSRIPLAGMAMSASVAALCYFTTSSVVEGDARQRFDTHARNAQTTIQVRIKSYTAVLRGTASFMQTSVVTREQFRVYVAGLALERHFPALLSINFAQYVPADKVEQFVQQQRAEQREHYFGNRPFAIMPPVARPEHAVIIYIEDGDKSLSSFGFDLFSVPDAAQATVESRDTGNLVTSGHVVAAISSPGKVGLAMRLPVYRASRPFHSVADRRAAYVGSVGVAFSVPRLLDGVREEIPIPLVRMRLTDHGPGAAGLAAGVTTRALYDSQSTLDDPYPAFTLSDDDFVATLPIDYNGRPWMVVFSTPKSALYTQFDRMLPWLALFAGLLGSGLLYALFHALSTSRRRAIHLAHEMTEELRDSQSKLEQSHERLRQLVAHADEIKESERKRIAREIHDDLGQNLLALRIDADLLATRTGTHHPRLHARARATLSHIDATIRSIRQIINDLRPNVLDLGLSAAVEWQIAEFIRRTGIECELVVDALDVDVHDNCATAFFRILQESLNNIVRHAKATRVRVELLSHDGMLLMTVTDNGVGLPRGGRNKAGSFGLIGIEERVTILGGAFTISGKPGEGTAISVMVNINKECGAAPPPKSASTERAAPALVPS